MSTQATWEQIEQAYREVGLPAEMLDRLRNRLMQPAAAAPTVAPATSRELQIMELIGTKTVDRLLHDVRNVLNENALLRAVANLDDEKK